MNWTATGYPTNAADALGEAQRGRAYHLTFTHPDRPGERVLATIGAVYVGLGRYSAHVETEHQTQRMDESWDIAPGTMPVYHQDEFYSDHDDQAGAWRDRDQAIDRWAQLTLTDADLNIDR